MRLNSFRPTRFLHLTSILLGSLTLMTMITAAPCLGDVIVSCSFEPNGDTWQYTAAGNGSVSNDAGPKDDPANQRIMAGSGSWQLAGIGNSTLVFSDVLLAGWTKVSVTYHVSATADDSNKGKNGSDLVQAYVADTAKTFGNSANITLKGRSNAKWGYDRTSSPRTQTAGSEIITVQPTNGGLQTTNSYSSYKISLAGNDTSVAFKISATGNTANTFWNLDEIALNGTASSSHTCRWNGVSGQWDNSTAARWTDQTNANTSSTWNAVRGDNAYFTQAGSTATIAAGTTVAARSLTFSADGCTILANDSVSKLALTNGGSGGAGANTIEVAEGNTATINASIVGNPKVGLAKTGSGALVLNGNNFYTGDTIVHEGALVLGQKSIIRSTTIDVRSGATLDFSAGGPYTLADGITLKGSGNVIGNLIVAGTHSPGNSMGIETIQGDYTMDGLLQVAVGGTTPGDAVGYDQVLIAGDSSHDVSLSGVLALTWTGFDWSAPGDKLWVLRNDTNGSLDGVFCNYSNGGSVGSYDGRLWNIYYGADAATGNLTGGNDVLLSTSPVPEPSALCLLVIAAVFTVARLRRQSYCSCRNG